MRMRRGQTGGFSLLEVLFAVVILTLGLIFVATQFPMALMNSRRTAEASIQAVESENLAVELELRLKGRLATGVLLDDDDRVHLLEKANLLVEEVSGDTIVRLDDLRYDVIGFTPLHWSEINQGYSYNAYTSIFVGDVGQMMLPAVGIYDPEVYSTVLTEQGWDYKDDESEYSFLVDSTLDLDVQLWNEVVVEKALEKKYNWCALYRCLNPLPVGEGTKFRFYLFILRTESMPGIRYAVNRDEDVKGYPAAVELSAQTTSRTDLWDRRLPVPWYVEWPSQIADNVDLVDLSDFPNDFAEHLVSVTRPGMHIIDAAHGHVYRVREIIWSDDNEPFLRLEKPTIDPMDDFWMFPPALVERVGGQNDADLYADENPVVGLTIRDMTLE